VQLARSGHNVLSGLFDGTLPTAHQPLRARYTNVVHDLGLAEPRSRVKQSSCSITLHQLEPDSNGGIEKLSLKCASAKFQNKEMLPRNISLLNFVTNL